MSATKNRALRFLIWPSFGLLDLREVCSTRCAEWPVRPVQVRPDRRSIDKHAADANWFALNHDHRAWLIETITMLIAALVALFAG